MEKGLYGGLLTPAPEGPSETAGAEPPELSSQRAGLSPDWDQVLKFVDPALRPVLDLAAQKGLPPPQVGFELQGDDGGVIAQAEAAWEDARLAWLRDDEMEFAPVFADAGWQTAFLAEVAARPEEHLAPLIE
ncbi:MAG: hypothetical protein WHS86_09850 [Desulfosoma sp.]